MYKNLRTNLPRELMSCALASRMRRLAGASACLHHACLARQFIRTLLDIRRADELIAVICELVGDPCTGLFAANQLSVTNLAVCRRFTDFPFTTELVRDSRDARRFCGHAEVLAYLDAFAECYRLRPHIRYGRRVLRALPLWAEQRGEGGGPRWRVTTCAAGHAGQVRRCALGAPAAWILLWVAIAA